MTPESKLRARQKRNLFIEEAAKPDDAIRLDFAALLIAAEEQARVDIDVASCIVRLESMCEMARESIARSNGAAVAAFNHFMFVEQGFTGNRLDYYDPRNSFLNRVIERRTGIPITLSIVYIEVGRRAGLDVEGVGMPGHFIVRVRERGSVEATLVDPFHGRTLDPAECQQRMDEALGGQVLLTAAHLRATPKREILARLLLNLKAIYVQADLYREALACVERILILTPGAVSEHRDGGALLAQLGHLPEAIAETGMYLQLAPDAPDAAQVREQILKLQRLQAMRN